MTYYNLTNFKNKYKYENNYVDSIFNICTKLKYKSVEFNSTCLKFKIINKQVLEKILNYENVLE